MLGSVSETMLASVEALFVPVIPSWALRFTRYLTKRLAMSTSWII